MLNRNNYEEDLEAFDEAINLDPKDASEWYNKGKTLVNLGRHEEALDAFNKAIELDPKSAAAWYAKGYTLGGLGRLEEALKELYRVLQPQSRVVLDIPNPDHPYVTVMAGIEEYLGRRDIISSRTDFETLLGPLFVTERINDSQVMIKYFVKTAK